MKKEAPQQTHPVVFVDTSSGAEFITTSTLKSGQTRDINGVKHFVINIEISSASHPFYTGKQIFVDTARRVEKFQEKMAKVEKTSQKRKGKKVKHAAKAKAKKGESKKVVAKKNTKTEIKEEAETKQ